MLDLIARGKRIAGNTTFRNPPAVTNSDGSTVSANPQVTQPLTAEDLFKVNHWLDLINEADPQLREGVMEKCRVNPKALKYVVEELSKFNQC